MVNGWYRCSVTGTSNGTSLVIRYFTATEDGTTTYNGDGTSGLYIFGANLSQTTYAPPYAYTNGATATVTADVITGAGDATTFAGVQSEGVFYCEIATNGFDATTKVLNFGNTGDDRLQIYYQTTENLIKWYCSLGATAILTASSSVTETDFNK